MPKPRTALLISPYYPPMGVSGAKRALHLSRHLPAEGWRTVVLAADPFDARRDDTLLDCIPEGTVVDYGFTGRLRPWLKQRKSSAPKASAGPAKAKKPKPSWWPKQDPAFLTPFDRYLADVPAGFAAARRLIKAHRPSVIHVSADPWAPLIVARAAARLYNIPLVVDFRDPWSQHAGKMAKRPAAARAALRRFEAGLFADAAKVILNTEAAREQYVQAYFGHLPPEKFATVRNAYDTGLFYGGEVAQRAPFVVTYFGRFRQFVEPDALFEGWARFVESAALSPSDAKLRVVGGLSDAHRALAASFGIAGHLEVGAPVDFRDSLSELRAAHVLALVIQPASRLQIPGKLYDYLAAGRPILAVSANPEADAILAHTRAGLSARHGDAAHIAAQLERLRAEPYAPDAAAVASYSAQAQAARVAEIYNEAI
jgi:hypothetical protein